MIELIKHAFRWIEGAGIALILLKLTEEIDWSWVWVLSPFWISWLVAIPIIIIYIMYLWYNRRKLK